MSYIGHLNLNSVPDSKIKQNLILQSQKNAPAISDEYYRNINEIFYPMNMQFEGLYKKMLDIFPKDFMEEIRKEKFTHISKVLSIDVSSLFSKNHDEFSKEEKDTAFNSYKEIWKRFKNKVSEEKFLEIFDDKVAFYLIGGIAKELKLGHGLSSAIVKHRRDDITTENQTLFICFPNEIKKNLEGKWIEERKGGAVAKFFGMTAAKGLIDEQALYDNGIMLGLQHREILSTIKQLKDEGVEPILQNPIHKGQRKELNR